MSLDSTMHSLHSFENLNMLKATSKMTKCHPATVFLLFLYTSYNNMYMYMYLHTAMLTFYLDKTCVTGFKLSNYNFGISYYCNKYSTVNQSLVASRLVSVKGKALQC